MIHSSPRIFSLTTLYHVYLLDPTNLWTVDGRFSVKIVSAGNLNVGKDASVSVRNKI